MFAIVTFFVPAAAITGCAHKALLSQTWVNGVIGPFAHGNPALQQAEDSILWERVGRDGLTMTDFGHLLGISWKV